MPTAKHKIMLGDILPPLNSYIAEYGNPIDLSAYTLKFRLLDSANTVVLDDVTSGVTAHPTQTFTAEADDEYLTCNGHGCEPGYQIVLANSGGALPTGLATATRYWPVNITPNRFQVAASPGGPAVTFTTDGTGTHTFYIVGSCQMDFASTEVDTAGLFKGYWRLYSGSEFSTFPKGQGEYIPVEVSALG